MAWTYSNNSALQVVSCTCPHCKETFEMNKRSFANHVRWCKSNPRYEEILKSTREKNSKLAKEKIIREKGEFQDFKVVCATCGKEFIVSERANLFPSKEKYYCCKSCANTHIVSEETKKKIADSVNRYYIENGFRKKKEKQVKRNTRNKRNKETNFNKICKICGKEFISLTNTASFCSRSCIAKYKLRKKLGLYADESIEKIKELQKIYRRACNFNFSLNSFPEEFDFSLIEEFGWYTAKNHGNNMDGISRDHKFSVLEGFNQKIDPYYISHPANCQLLQQRKNASKCDKCSFSLDELKKAVEEWNNKYGIYENTIDYFMIEDFKSS